MKTEFSKGLDRTKLDKDQSTITKLLKKNIDVIDSSLTSNDSNNNRY